jgi:hypothetical protein
MTIGLNEKVEYIPRHLMSKETYYNAAWGDIGVDTTQDNKPLEITVTGGFDTPPLPTFPQSKSSMNIWLMAGAAVVIVFFV